MALVRVTQGLIYNYDAKTIDLSRVYQNFEPARVKQIRQDNDGRILYAAGSATATASFSNGVATLTGATAAQVMTGYSVSVLYDEPDNDSPHAASVVMTAGTTYQPGRAVWVVATAAGSISMTLLDGSVVVVPVVVGLNTFPVAATQFSLAGGAAATVYNMT